MVNGNNSNSPSHNNNVTNGANVNALNAANLSGTSAAPTNNTDFGDNLNSKSEFFFVSKQRFSFLFLFFRIVCRSVSFLLLLVSFLVVVCVVGFGSVRFTYSLSNIRQ